MFLRPAALEPARVSALRAAAESAARMIPPAFPLDATVAVNPYLGHAGDDLATAAARMARVAGIALTPPRARHAEAHAAGRITDEDLAAALFASTSPLKPVDLAFLKARMRLAAKPRTPMPTVADLAAQAEGTDWPALVARCIGTWAAGHFDRGQAFWSPAPGQGAWDAWRAWASHDLTPEIAGLSGFCARVAAAPDSAERAVLQAADRLGLSEEGAPSVFHRLLIDLGGWAQHAAWLAFEAAKTGTPDPTLTDLLAIRLTWEEALLAHAPQVAADWAQALAAVEAPAEPDADMVVDAILQDAAERAWQRRLAQRLSGPAAPRPARPTMQAVFCIDVRSERMRRALESLDPGIETHGFAGFFGLPVAHSPAGSTGDDCHLPVLLSPALHATSQAAPGAETETRIAARASRAWGRFKQAAVSSFAFVEAAGPLHGAGLVADALALRRPAPPAPAPRFDPPLSAEQKTATALAVLKGTGLVAGHAPLVLLIGHGATVTNTAHASAYQCGACGGRSGAVSARLLAGLLNDPQTRAGLAAAGFALPEDTRFVAGLHDTVTDAVTLFEDPAADRAAVARAEAWLAAAAAAVRVERAPLLPGARPATLAARALDWAQTRPEWGLAGCAGFIAAPRSATRGRDLGGRVFLHDYDWRQDGDLSTLELILGAPVVVASWIALQYYGSTVAPEVHGAGDKLLHNVTGGIGVVEGNGGRLRAGLPRQAVDDGTGAVHEPLRLSVMVEAPAEAIDTALARLPGVTQLVASGWLSLLRLEDGRLVQRRAPAGGWGRL